MDSTKTKEHTSPVRILTLELENNYGGILQAYALQSVTRQYSNDVATTYYTPRFSGLKKILGYSRRLLFRHVLRRKVSDLSIKDSRLIAKNTLDFVKNNIHIEKNSKLSSQQGTLIVGSDQVWRAAYVDVQRYLLSKSSQGNANKISYAASFGKDDLSEYSPSLVRKTAKLAQKFTAISVRESSGITLVTQHWNMQASHHVDPTLLIDRERYEEIAKHSTKTSPVKGKVFSYVLDKSPEKNAVVDKISRIKQEQAFTFMPPKAPSRKELHKNPSKYQLPYVEQWLRSFSDAEYIVTDSFHGTVFAIIFNKSFIAIGNKNRGLARFQSLLQTFGLEDRLVESMDDVTDELIARSIDWERVNRKIKAEQKRSFDYLKKHLGKE